MVSTADSDGRVDLHHTSSPCRLPLSAPLTESTNVYSESTSTVATPSRVTVVLESVCTDSDLVREGTVLHQLNEHLRSKLHFPRASASDIISDYSDKNIFALGFPELFPNGTGDYDRDKTRIGQKTTELQFIHHLFNLSDRRFAKSKSFLFYVYSRTQRKEVNNVIAAASGKFTPLQSQISGNVEVRLRDILNEVSRRMNLLSASESIVIGERLPISADAEIGGNERRPRAASDAVVSVVLLKYDPLIALHFVLLIIVDGVRILNIELPIK